MSIQGSCASPDAHRARWIRCDWEKFSTLQAFCKRTPASCNNLSTGLPGVDFSQAPRESFELDGVLADIAAYLKSGTGLKN
jgi:hypothetical protein